MALPDISEVGGRRSCYAVVGPGGAPVCRPKRRSAHTGWLRGRKSLREIADSTISPEDLREELVHSLQKFVEVDEPEPDTVPLIGSAGASVDADDTEVAVERMTEEELLKGLEGLAPPEEQPEEDE